MTMASLRAPLDSDSPARQRAQRRDGQHGARERPGLVAGQARRGQRPGRPRAATALPPSPAQACIDIAPSMSSAMSSGSVIGVDCRYRMFGLSASSAGAEHRAGPRAGGAQHHRRAGVRGHAHAHDRDRDAGGARAIERVDLDRQQIQQVRQRQPDGADLLPARRDAVDDAPRDDQVRLRVVVAERQALQVIDPRRDARPRRSPRARTTRRRSDRAGRAVGRSAHRPL